MDVLCYLEQVEYFVMTHFQDKKTNVKSKDDHTVRKQICTSVTTALMS